MPTRPRSDSGPLPARSQRLRWRDVEHWRDADKVLLVSLLTMPFAVGWMLRLRVLTADPSASSYVSRRFLPLVFAFTWIQVLAHAALIGAALLARRSATPRASWLVHAEVQTWFLCMSFSLYAMGPFTSSYGVLWLAVPITGFLLFEERPVLLGLLTGSLGALGGILLPAIGLLPYAPFVEVAPFGQGVLHRGWLMAVGMPSVFATIVVLVVFVSLVRRLRSRQAELLRLSRTDALTGLANRGSLFERLGEELARARRYGHPVSLVMIDADHFKAINDQHGHVVGDRVLRELAARVQGELREHDVAARYGGEELAVLLPHAPLDGARTVAERLVAAARSVTFEGQRLTVSAGVAQALDAEAADELVARADAALYESKRAGRDRVSLAPTPR